MEPKTCPGTLVSEVLVHGVKAMKTGKIVLITISIIVASFPAARIAQAREDVSLFARPDISSRVVASVTADAAFTIHGCLADKSWCDVSFEDHRGWISGAFHNRSFANGQAYTVMTGPYVPAPVDNSIYHTEHP
jgi:uncharacterized protein YraI